MTTKISMGRAKWIYGYGRATDRAEALAAARKLRSTTSSLHRPVLARWAAEIEAAPERFVDRPGRDGQGADWRRA